MCISGKYYCINAKKMYTYSEKSMILFVITPFVAFKICFKQLSSESAYERNLKMDNKIIYVKLIKGCDPIDHFEQSYQTRNDNKQNYYYYNLNQGSEIEDINDNSLHYIIGLIHSNKKIELAYLGLCNKHTNNKGVSLLLDIKVKMENCTSIENIQKLSELDLDSDFGDSSYVLVEDSELIAKQIDFIIKKPLECSVLQRTYSCLDTEKDLHPLAQKNQYCRRQYNLRDSMKNRGEFQRDYERIVHSKSFRRMVDKILMKLSSAEGAKLLKKLKSEYDALKSKESISSTFLASVGENPESVRPKYDYKEAKAELDSLALKIRKLKHAINLFNTTTVISGYDITIDEMLVFIPQLSAKKQKLSEMASRLPKAREEQGHGRASNIIDYRYVNYDIDEVTKDLLAVTDELSDAQLALDLINHSATFEVEL